MTTRALRPGFWKPYLTGTLSGAAAALPALAAGNLPGAISSGIAGGKIGYNAHEAIRKKYNIPWLGKRKGKGRRVGRPCKKTVSKKSRKSSSKKRRK
jgi:hypothetical protein